MVFQHLPKDAVEHPEEQESIEHEEALEKGSQRGIYLLPNLLTTAALFAGFYAIVAAMRGYFDAAATAIFVALVADGLDGRVARFTNSQSSFGAQYDSLSDMAAFGIAPALVLYSWSLHGLGKVGWLAAFLYTAGTALRLARFNTQHADKSYFQGLPCPAAAGFMASMVWIGSSFNVKGVLFDLPLSITAIIVAALMVSTIRYYSFKSIDFRGRVPFLTIVVAVFTIAAIALEPPEMLFILFSLYLISGPIVTLLRLQQMRKLRKKG
jgi:CDP-diacylglycerol--serine O-phosphatidyltransferase